MVGSGKGDIEENRKNGQKIEKNFFPYFGVLVHQKHSHVGRILKKSVQGSIHAQLYMAIKDPFGQFQLQLRTANLR